MIETLPATAQPAAVSESILEFQRIAKGYGRHTVLGDLDLAVPAGVFAVVFGPPASGKSVLARILMGLEKPDAGQVWLRGVDVTFSAPADRNIGYVPQSFALFPHLNVRDNIAYPLKLAGADRGETNAVVARAAEMLHITDLLAKRPDQLSGGQKQRVAIARGIAKRTDVFVLDDPLAGLDFKLRERLVDDLKTLQDQTSATFLYTTSDPLETLILADQVAILDSGRIVETGKPERLYSQPQHVRCMALLGFPRANLLEGELVPGPSGPSCQTVLFSIPIELTSREALGSGRVEVGFRPESLTLQRAESTASAATSSISFPATVLLREDLGGEEIVYLDCGGTPVTTVVRHFGENHVPNMGEPAVLTLDPADIVVFSPGGSCVARGANG